ncbi:MAG TPA: hypothetical protein VH063_03730 [Gaiellaceae bacterium]|jgi:hypothetical protein|nr:hypothetical protein [Gaiellaceae bacterium]
MKTLFAAAALVLPPSVHPWPIGAGPRYLPPAKTTAVVAGTPVGELLAGAAGPSFRIHLELFANRKVVVVPAGIGISPRGVYPIRTTSPGGVVEVARGTKLRVADIFRVWGQALGSRRLASFSGPVRAYVGGKLVQSAAGAIPLTPHAEIVLELGGYVAPHPFFLFPGGDS